MKGIEPSTRSLGSYCSTTELHPHSANLTVFAQSCKHLIALVESAAALRQRDWVRRGLYGAFAQRR